MIKKWYIDQKIKNNVLAEISVVLTQKNLQEKRQ
jgi:hypothetical protein